MNRTALGLAVGAGYVLGRTKKMKLAFAVGTLVAGKRMQLSPKALMDLARQQLENNPQFKEIGDQLREDFRGVGKAASGALLERRLESLSDRLHDRTLDVRDRLSGVPDEEEYDAGDAGDAGDDEPSRRRRAPAKKAAQKAQGAQKKAPAKPAKKASAKRTAAKTAPAKKSTAAKSAAGGTAKKTTGPKSAAKSGSRTAAKAARGTARRATGSRAKGGRDHG
ncbi:DNA primase [Streptomyces monticola]|uniref:DNA primase n=1 Tax=Streptomyces monticola TaxID=2666263 RepID=A0ABW2JBE2_9ACTN